jgi:hypothetical protein
VFRGSSGFARASKRSHHDALLPGGTDELVERRRKGLCSAVPQISRNDVAAPEERLGQEAKCLVDVLNLARPEGFEPPAFWFVDCQRPLAIKPQLHTCNVTPTKSMRARKPYQLDLTMRLSDVYCPATKTLYPNHSTP